MRGEKEMWGKGSKALVIIILSIFILGLSTQGKELQDIEVLASNFEQTEASLNEYWLHIGIPYETYQGETALLQQGNILSRAFQLDPIYQLPEAKETSYTNQGKWKSGAEVELILKRQSEQSKSLYLIVAVHGTSDLASWRKDYTQLYKILQNTHITATINACIQGNISDTLNNNEQHKLIGSILHKLDAEKVESLESDLVTSVSAYSPRLQHKIWTGNQQMNVQVATHVNRLDQKTVLTVGTPIIKIEY